MVGKWNLKVNLNESEVLPWIDIANDTINRGTLNVLMGSGYANVLNAEQKDCSIYFTIAKQRY